MVLRGGRILPQIQLKIFSRFWENSYFLFFVRLGRKMASYWFNFLSEGQFYPYRSKTQKICLAKQIVKEGAEIMKLNRSRVKRDEELRKLKNYFPSRDLFAEMDRVRIELECIASKSFKMVARRNEKIRQFHLIKPSERSSSNGNESFDLHHYY